MTKYSEQDLYNYVYRDIEDARFFSHKFKVENATRNFINRTKSRISRTIRSDSLEIMTLAVKYVENNYYSVHYRIKTEKALQSKNITSKLK